MTRGNCRETLDVEASSEGGALAELPTGTVTFLFTDIEGSTRLVARMRERYADVLERHARLLRDAFEEHGGQEIDTQGDAFFAVFSRAGDAVAAAVAAQRALAAEPWPDGIEVLVRMGLHTGEPIVGPERYVGLGIHRAQRICAAGHGGQVLLSEVTRGLVEDDLPDDVVLRDLGVAKLKDLERPERLTQLVVEGLPTDFPPLRTGETARPFAGREGELADAAATVTGRPFYRRRSVLVGALAGVVAAAVAIPIFALAQGGSGSGPSEVSANSVGVIDAARNKLSDEVTVGVNPSAVAVGSGAVWVANADGNSVSRVDPGTNTVRQTIPVGNSPSGIVLGDGAVWVANTLSGTVSRIDPATNQVVDRIDVGNGPSSLAYGAGAVWVINAGDGTISKIDPGKGRVIKTFPVVGGADNVAVGFGSLWVVSTSSNAVYRINPHTFGLVPIAVGHGPSAVAVSSRAVWVANGLDDTVMQIDPSSNSIAGLTHVDEGPSGIAVGPGAVWVANEFGGTVARLDSASGKLTRTIGVGNRPKNLAVMGRTVYVILRAGAGAHRGGTIRYLIPPGPGTQDLRLVVDPAVSNIFSGEAYDSLVGFRRVGGATGAQIVPDLATAMPSLTDDGKTYTFQLRRGIRYSNGQVVKPEDFRYGLQRVFKLNPFTASFFGAVEGAPSCAVRPRSCDLSTGVVTDDASYSIAFHLSVPDPEFLDKLALNYTIPVPAGWPVDASGRHVPPTTAATMLASATPKQLVFVRNPHFHEWAKAARPDRYTDKEIFTVAKSTGAALDAVEQGKADVAYAFNLSSVPRAALRKVRTSYGSQAHFDPLPQTVYLTLHTKVPPFDDVRVRRALNYAIDRRKVVALWGGTDTAAVTCQVLPPNLPGYRRYCPYTLNPNSRGSWSAPDLGKAKSLVAASGTRGTPVVFWSRGDAYPGGRRIAEYVASVLRQLGYRVRLRFVAPNAPAVLGWRNRRRVSLNQQDWYADYPAASDFINNLLSCGAIHSPARGAFNLSEFCDRRIDGQIKRALSLDERDPSAGSALWTRIDRELVDQAPWVPLLNPKSFDFVSKRVGNYQYNPEWHGLGDQLWVR